MSPSSPAPAADPVNVVINHYDKSLQASPPATWPLAVRAGSLLAVEALPSGELLALAREGDGHTGPLRLIRRGTDGASAGEAQVDLGSSEMVLGWRVAADGTLILVTTQALRRLSPGDGHVIVKRALPAPASSPAPVEGAAGEHGAWLRYADHLQFVGLNTPDSVSQALPVYDLAAAPAVSPDQPQAAGVRAERIVANAAGVCFLTENVVRDYPLKGSWGIDRTAQLAVTIIDAHGKKLGQIVFGTIQSRREWFWTQDRTGRALIPDFGIVRKRHEGLTMLNAMGETRDGVFLVAGEGLMGLDAAARVQWRAPARSAGILPVAWSRPSSEMFVLTHAPWKVMLLDAQGRPLHEAAVAANASLLNFSAAAALRATTTGEWLMITHPFVLKGSPEDIRAAANSR